jgi:multidrug efflux pump subunit AcrB
VCRYHDTLSTYMGSTYVNDFNILGAHLSSESAADNPFWLSTRDVEALRTRSNAAEMVPLGAVATFRDITRRYRVPRYNLFPAVPQSQEFRQARRSARSNLMLMVVVPARDLRKKQRGYRPGSA